MKKYLLFILLIGVLFNGMAFNGGGKKSKGKESQDSITHTHGNTTRTRANMPRTLHANNFECQYANNFEYQ